MGASLLRDDRGVRGLVLRGVEGLVLVRGTRGLRLPPLRRLVRLEAALGSASGRRLRPSRPRNHPLSRSSACLTSSFPCTRESSSTRASSAKVDVSSEPTAGSDAAQVPRPGPPGTPPPARKGQPRPDGTSSLRVEGEVGCGGLACWRDPPGRSSPRSSPQTRPP